MKKRTIIILALTGLVAVLLAWIFRDPLLSAIATALGLGMGGATQARDEEDEKPTGLPPDPTHDDEDHNALDTESSDTDVAVGDLLDELDELESDLDNVQRGGGEGEGEDS